MLQIPQKKKWVQATGTEVLGNIWASFNIDLSDNIGRLRIGRRLLVNTNSTDDSDLGVPVAFRSIGSVIYAIAGAKVFKTGAAYPSSTFTEDVTSGVPTNLNSDYSDMSDFNGYLYVTANSTSVYKTDGSTWANFPAGSSTGAVRLLTSYGDRMYMTDGTNKIISWNTSDSVASIGSAYTLDLSSNGDTRIITFMRSSASRIWIGTVNTKGGKGVIYEWDGISTQATRAYRLEASGALSCVIKDDIPYVIDTNANLLAWNGGNFPILTGLNRENHILLTSPLSRSTNRFIHPNGMSIVEGKINLLIKGTNGDNTSTIEDTISSGVYEYDKDFGLVHKHSLGTTKSGDTITDFGQIKIGRAGALTEINLPETSAARNGSFLAGAELYTNATPTSLFVIAYDDLNDTLQKAGHLITTKIDSPNVDEMWQGLFVKVKKFLSSNDKMVVKYRKEEVDAVEGTITWTSTTTFTTTADISSFAVGDEVQVIQGLGSGKPSHITVISYSAPTYTVTVDETYTGATGTSRAKFDKWIKIGSLSNQISTYLTCPIGKVSNWIQFKIWITFTGRKEELEELLLVNSPNQKPIL